MHKTPFAVALIVAPLLAFSAQEKQGATHLDAVTISGTRTATSVMNSPVSIAVVDKDEIEKRGADSVAELLRDVPGVTITDSAVAGMKRIRIRGEQANRVVILVDGQEMTDHSSFGSPLLVDPANIERIEVVRGPASVMHGAKAIGGVLNIITKKGADKPVELEVAGGYHSGTQGWQGLAAVSGTVEDFDYRLSFSADDHGDRSVAKGEHNPTGKKLPNSGFENQDINLHLGLKLGEEKNHYLAFKANQHKLEADGWEDNFALVEGLPVAGIANGVNSGEVDVIQFNANLPKRDLNKYGLYYSGELQNSVIKKVSADVFHQKVERKFNNAIKLEGNNVKYANFPPSLVALGMESESVDDTETMGGSAQFDLNLLENHYTVFGLQFLNDSLKTDKINQVFLEKVVPPATFPVSPPAHLFPILVGDSQAYDEASMQTLSAFAQDEWAITENTKFIMGGRYYHVKSKLDETTSDNHQSGDDASNKRFVKAFGLIYSGLPHSTLRASYAEGFVVPTLLEQFTDSRAGRGIVLHGNPNLKPELSKNYELGLRYQNRGVVFDSTLFYTTAKDYITFESCALNSLCPANASGDAYVNADEAKSFGLELLAEYWIEGTSLTPYINTTWMRREITMADFATYKTDVPTLSGQSGIRYENYLSNAEVWADLFVQGGTKVDKRERPIEESGKESRHLAGWGTLNFALGGYVGTDSQYRVALNLNNLTDKHYRASVDEMPAMGRNAVLTFGAKF